MTSSQAENQYVNELLIKEWTKEKRAERRWRYIKFIIGLLFVLLVIFVIIPKHFSRQGDLSKGYVSLVRLNGLIAPGQDFSSETVVPILKEAFSDAGTKGVILDINSGGGTPVQASIIHDAIINLKSIYKKPVIVVGEDALASGAYYVAVAADKIYVNPNTITGSIGVIMKTFGFPDLIQKIGVQRRVITAGENKDRLDPFLPENPNDIEKLKQVISEVHTNFEHAVLKGRKNKLTADKAMLFSGDFWSGVTAVKLGLADGLGNLDEVMMREFKVNAYKDFSKSDSIIRNLFGQLGATLSVSKTSLMMQSEF